MKEACSPSVADGLRRRRPSARRSCSFHRNSSARRITNERSHPATQELCRRNAASERRSRGEARSIEGDWRGNRQGVMEQLQMETDAVLLRLEAPFLEELRQRTAASSVNHCGDCHPQEGRGYGGVALLRSASVAKNLRQMERRTELWRVIARPE